MHVGVSLQNVFTYMQNSSSATVFYVTKLCGTKNRLTFCLLKQLLVDWFDEVDIKKRNILIIPIKRHILKKG